MQVLVPPFKNQSRPHLFNSVLQNCTQGVPLEPLQTSRYCPVGQNQAKMSCKGMPKNRSFTRYSRPTAKYQIILVSRVFLAVFGLSGMDILKLSGGNPIKTYRNILLKLVLTVYGNIKPQMTFRYHPFKIRIVGELSD